MTTEQVFDAIAKHILNLNKENPRISKSTVGWQLDHCLKVHNAVYESLALSKPEKYKPRFSFSKSLVMLTGFIPRGKAKAPKQVVATAEITENSLLNQLELAKANYAKSLKLAEGQYFSHPLFGHIKKVDALKFANIHSKHH